MAQWCSFANTATTWSMPRRTVRKRWKNSSTIFGRMSTKPLRSGALKPAAIESGFLVQLPSKRAWRDSFLCRCRIRNPAGHQLRIHESWKNSKTLKPGDRLKRSAKWCRVFSQSPHHSMTSASSLRHQKSCFTPHQIQPIPSHFPAATPIRKTCNTFVGEKLHSFALIPHTWSLPHFCPAKVWQQAKAHYVKKYPFIST